MRRGQNLPMARVRNNGAITHTHKTKKCCITSHLGWIGAERLVDQ